MLNKQEILWLSSFLKTSDGKRMMDCLSKICGVEASLIPGEDQGKVCPQVLSVQAGRRSVYYKIRAAERIGDKR